MFTARAGPCVVSRSLRSPRSGLSLTLVRQVLDDRFVPREVDIDMHDARQPVQRPCHMAHARATGHAVDAEPGRVDMSRVASFDSFMSS